MMLPVVTTTTILCTLWLSLPIADSTIITPCSNRALVQPVREPGDAVQPSPHVLIIKDKEGLLTIGSPDYRVTGEFAGTEDALDVDYHAGLDLLVWSTSSGGIYAVGLEESRLARCTSRPRLRYREERWLPASIAVDYVAGRLYVLDTRSNSVRLMDLVADDGVDHRHAVLGVGERDFRPARLELDSAEGFVFLMDHGEVGREGSQHILRMKLDGGEPRIIDPPALGRESLIGGMALDRAHKRVLVSSLAQRRIFAMDYEGRVMSTLLSEDAAISISLARDQLFWVNAFKYHHNGTAAYLDGSAYRCRYTPGAGCEAGTVERIDEKGVVLAVLAVEAESQRTPAGLQGSQCRADGGEPYCRSQFCVHGSRRSCVCQVGWGLRKVREDCELVRDFLVYEDDGVLRGACLEGNGTRCQAIVPALLPELSFKEGERTGFDYDPTTRKLYYGGKDAIYRADVDTGSRVQLLYQKGVFFGPLAVDRTSKNLYYTEIEQRGNVSFYIMKVMSVRSDHHRDDADAKLLAQTSSSILWEFGGVHTIALHTDRGYLFVSIFNNAKRRHQLLRLNADAKNATLLTGLENSTFVSVDSREDRLYTLSADNSDIRSSSLDGREVRKIGSAKALGASVCGFLVRGNVIYVQNQTSLRKFDKTSGEDLGEVELFPYDRRMAAGLKIHDGEEATRNDDLGRNPCSEVSGGYCDNFCFAVPAPGRDDELKRVCRCFDGVKCRERI